jgi:hypothetical protein
VISYGGASRRLGGFDAPGDYATFKFPPTLRHDQPMLAGVAVRRVAGGGSQPEIGPGQHPKLVLLEEIDGGIKDRPLAVVALDRRKVGLASALN